MSTATLDYSTADLDAAAFLVSRGHQLVRVEKVANGRSSFVFPPAAQADVGAFYAGATVKAIDFGGALRMVKKQMYDTRATQHTTRENYHADARDTR